MPHTAIPNNEPLTYQQSSVLTALAAGLTITEAAAKAGVHRCTVHAWRRANSNFSAALKQAQEAFQQAALLEVQSLSTAAVDTLRHCLTDESVPAAVRLRAALAVLDRVTAPTAPPQIEANSAAGQPNATKSDTPVETARDGAFQNEANPAATPRNAPCPCGSSQKYKRCCGKNAPPHLNLAA
jgi:uncharacterized protein (UPF0147 family)